MAEAHESDFTFVGSRIKKLSFTNPFVRIPANTKRTVELDYVVDDVEKDEDEESLRGVVTLSIKMQIKHGKQTSALRLELEGCFDSFDGQEDAFTDMLKINGTTMLYSIARSIIQTITAQSYLDQSVTLPMVNIVSLYEAKEKKDGDDAPQE